MPRRGAETVRVVTLVYKPMNVRCPIRIPETCMECPSVSVYWLLR